MTAILRLSCSYSIPIEGNMIRNPDDLEIRKVANLIAVKARNVIMSLLRDEEIADCDAEFSRIAEEAIRQLSPYRGK